MSSIQPVNSGVTAVPARADKWQKPTAAQATRVFWQLGDRFWLQIIDGTYHQHGPMVFDEGLHGRTSEPGFFKSLREGCDFTSRHIGEPLTVSFYQELHKTLCAHFNGAATGTEMDVTRCGMFRTASGCCKYGLHNCSPEAEEHHEIVSDYHSKRYMESIKLTDPAEHARICSLYPTSAKWVAEQHAAWDDKISALNQYIADLCAGLAVPVYARLARCDDIVSIKYDHLAPAAIENAVKALFERYHAAMQVVNAALAQSGDDGEIQQLLQQKIAIIADLYQQLEWLHPFSDGNGRTHLVMMCKLLCEEGLNPSILEYPYLSSRAFLHEWVDYLAQGIQQWRAAASR